VVLPGHRGRITDRRGQALAVSTPVAAAWPAGRLAPEDAELQGLQPAMAAFNPELPHRRYYPAGEVTGHLLGFTSGADVGQEGLERAFNEWLAGQSGLLRVRQDAHGNTVQELGPLRPPRPGHDLTLALDLRIQSLAYRELERARHEHGAVAGSLVVLDIATGEVLALVSLPSYNPNIRAQLASAVHSNHAATDLFEPGSTIKPFVVAAGLADGRYSATSVIDTSPGFVEVGHVREQDEHNWGVINLPTVLARSSNVGMARLALSLPPQEIWQTLHGVGFGQATGSGFPGEPAGVLTTYRQWRPAGIATLSHGYGLSATPLQLAHAYAIIGALGVARPVSLLPVRTAPAGERVLPERVCRELLGMLEAVVVEEGATGRLAAIPGYRVAGKTGTAEKLHDGHYDGQSYTALFAGIVPASRPRLAAVVVVDDVPGGGAHQGGAVAAPVFSRVMGATLALLGVPKDQPPARPPAAPGISVASASVHLAARR
jgi:cell division protein FtsI (penicillin-binding protein 3)